MLAPLPRRPRLVESIATSIAALVAPAPMPKPADHSPDDHRTVGFTPSIHSLAGEPLVSRWVTAHTRGF